MDEHITDTCVQIESRWPGEELELKWVRDETDR